MAIYLKPVDWLSAQDVDDPFGINQNWPPTSVQERILRSQLRWNLQHGQWDQVSTEARQFTVLINIYTILLDRLTEIICASEVSTGDDALDAVLNEEAAEGVRATIRDNTPIFWTDPETSQTHVLDARFWYPLSAGAEATSDKMAGWVYATPMGGVRGGVEGETEYGIPEMVKIGLQVGDLYTEDIFRYDSGTIGELLSHRRSIDGPSTIAIPGLFGQSIFDIVTPAVFEISRRYSRASEALNRISAPDYALLAGPDADIGPINTETNAMEDTIDEDLDPEVNSEQSAVQRQLSAIAGDNTFVDFASLGIQGVEPLTFSVDITGTTDIVTHMFKAIEKLAGMPNLFADDGGFAMAKSGVALRQLNIPVYAKTKRIQDLVRNGINASRALAGLPEVEWEEAFTVLEESAPAPNPQQMIPGQNPPSEE